SLLQDLRKGRRTEIEALNGYVADKGHQLGIPTPLNRALTELVLQCSSAGTFGDPETVCKTLLPLVG
ncbi:MAG TPA: ketopantoate reductase C-terminal domain-containing protein, partial [Acidimicrobiales bacterium]|nr:ketopantoate reductase C-terminal domain-containing protein [Acidimicrobiales bacterium]